MANPEDIVKAVREHAIKNYETGGWDVLVECWEDSDILEAAGGAKTVEGAIRKIGASLKVHDDYRKDIQAEIF